MFDGTAKLIKGDIFKTLYCFHKLHLIAEANVILLNCIQTGWSYLFGVIHRKVHESTSVLHVLSLSS